MVFDLPVKDRPVQGRVLVVDDEEHARKTVRMTLEKAGYEVLEADDGGKAITVLNAGDNPLMVDIIICDIRMPRSTESRRSPISDPSIRPSRWSCSPPTRKPPKQSPY